MPFNGDVRRLRIGLICSAVAAICSGSAQQTSAHSDTTVQSATERVIVGETTVAARVMTARAKPKQQPARDGVRDPLTRSGPMEFTHVRAATGPGCELQNAVVLTGSAKSAARDKVAAQDPAPGRDQVAAAAAKDTATVNGSSPIKPPSPKCFEWISADGTIDQSSPLRLKRILARLKGRKLPVFINSPGGAVDDAIEMARIIRSNGLDVVVARTEFASCSPREPGCNELKSRQIKLGTPAALARCASSCPFVLAGGVRRMVGPGAYVGLHRAATYRILIQVVRTYRTVPNTDWGDPTQTTRRIVAERPIARKIEPVETKRETYDKIEANFVTMGVTRGIMAPMLATPNTEMRWLTSAEITQFKLATDALNGQQLAQRDRPVAVVIPSVGPLKPGLTTTTVTRASDTETPLPADLRSGPAVSPTSPLSTFSPVPSP